VLARLPDAVLDGELVVPTADGRSDFEELRRRNLLQRPRLIAEASVRRPAVLVLLDVLELDGQDLRHQPLLERRKVMHAAIPQVSRLKVIEHLETHGEALSLQVSMATTRGSSPSERTHPIGRTE